MKKRPAKERKSKHVGNPPKDPQQQESPVDCAQTPQSIPQHKKELFLSEYSKLGTILKAAKAANIDRKTHYNWLKTNPEYAEFFERAKEDYLEKLEAEADRRAVEGTLRPVFHQGEECGQIREFSDTLLIFRLKCLAPEKYRENQRSTLTFPPPRTSTATFRRLKSSDRNTPGITKADKRAFYERCFDDRRWFIERFLQIKTRDQRVIPLKINEAQNRFFLQVEAQEQAGKPVRGIGLKAEARWALYDHPGNVFHKSATTQTLTLLRLPTT